MRESREESTLREVIHRLLVAVAAAVLTVAMFFVLPFLETISRPPENDLVVQGLDTAALPPPPPPPPPPEPEKEPEADDEKPPELTEQAAPLDLAQLELALNPGSFGDGLVGDFAVKLNTAAGGGGASGGDAEELFSLADLDQKPRALHPVNPVMDAAVRKRAPGTVTILFIVDQDGRVENPIVQAATDPVFEKPALAAIRQWKFEPGRRNGKPVRFRMKIPITFPAGR